MRLTKTFGRVLVGHPVY